MSTYDFAIIGAGIVGLATAYRLSQTHPDASVVVIEKEEGVAAHQSGHNSGVIHSGIFYKPGSLKAKNCREGRRALIEFCEREGVDYEMCGKVVVAADEAEVPELNRIEEKGRTNGVECTRIGPARLRELEPHVRGVDALHVPEAGIVDYPGIAQALADRLIYRGHPVRTGAEVTDLRVEPDQVRVVSKAGHMHGLKKR